MHTYELTAAVALWHGDEVLVLKRAQGFSAGGWFLPGGHLEPGERPAAAAARELAEETGIAVSADALAVAAVMTYPADGGTAHCIVFNAVCPAEAEIRLNGEHTAARWEHPAALAARLRDVRALEARGVDPAGIALAAEVAATLVAAARARGLPLPPLPLDQPGEVA